MTLYGPSIPIQVHVDEADAVRLSELAPGALPDSEPAPGALSDSEPDPASAWRRSR